MSEHIIRSLAKTATETLEFLRKSFKEFQESLGNLRRMPELFEKTQQAISESAARQINARGEMEIIHKMASLDSKRYLVHQEKQAINDFEKQLKEDIDYIRNRYNKIDDELNLEAKTRVRTLDEHLFELPTVFPEEFKSGLSRKIGPLVTQMEENANKFRLSRKSKIDVALDELLDSFQSFSDERTKFFEQVVYYQQQEPLEDCKIYNLPVTLIHKNGKPLAYFPGTMKLGKSIKETFNYTCHEYLSEFLSDNLKKITEQADDHLSWESKMSEKERIVGKLEEYVDKNFGSDKSSIKKAVREIVDKSKLQTLSC